MAPDVPRDAWNTTMASYEGSPYEHQGRAPGVGMDCPAPFICGAWEHGIKPRSFDITGYTRKPNGTLERLCHEHMRAIPFSEARAGDAILVAFRGEKFARHLGVLLDSDPSRRYWLHAEGYRYKRVIVNRLVFTDDLRLVGAFAVPGVT